MIVKIEGKLEAPKTVEGWSDSKHVHSWIKFAEIQGLHVNGSGQLDAHGSLWWNNPILKKKGNRPTVRYILFFYSTSVNHNYR